MAESTDNSRNEVEIDLDKYMSLIDKLDTAEDTIKEMQAEAAEAKKRLAPPKRKFMDIFLDDNDVNEKAIIGFISFFLIAIFNSSSSSLISSYLNEDIFKLGNSAFCLISWPNVSINFLTLSKFVMSNPL